MRWVNGRRPPDDTRVSRPQARCRRTGVHAPGRMDEVRRTAGRRPCPGPRPGPCPARCPARWPSWCPEAEMPSVLRSASRRLPAGRKIDVIDVRERRQGGRGTAGRGRGAQDRRQGRLLVADHRGGRTGRRPGGRARGRPGQDQERGGAGDRPRLLRRHRRRARPARTAPPPPRPGPSAGRRQRRPGTARRPLHRLLRPLRRPRRPGAADQRRHEPPRPPPQRLPHPGQAARDGRPPGGQRERHGRHRRDPLRRQRPARRPRRPPGPRRPAGAAVRRGRRLRRRPVPPRHLADSGGQGPEDLAHVEIGSA